MTRSPRERFQDNTPESTAHAELCVSPAFIRAVDAALLQYLKDLPAATDAHSSMAGSWKIEGAKGLVATLLTLADKAPLPGPRISSNLPGQVRDKY